MNQIDLLNKRILYIGQMFFHYDKRIVGKLKELNAKVDAFDIYPTANDYYFRFIKKLKLPNVESYLREYYNKMLENKDYDYVLIKIGFPLTVSFLKKLKDVNPNAKFINFHWDSIKPVYDYTHIIKYFDKVYSFDYEDCGSHSELTYLPLFYLDEYLEHNKTNSDPLKKIDLLFIGAWKNLERYQLIKLTKEICKQNQLSFYYYLYFPIDDQLLSFKKGIVAKEARFKRLSHAEILKLFSISNTIIDFPSSYQTGLTMRTFETLGAGKKLITINQNIVNEPFYDPEYIDIIDINKFNLNIDFIRNIPSHSIIDKMKNYSIENYINKLLQ
jgi:hypothetical protein